MQRVLPILSLSALLLACPSLFAQRTTGLTGALSGTVTDSQGRPQAGVEVRCQSKQITKTVRTGVDGRYRVHMVNPGHWRLRMARAGFSTAQETVMVYMNRVTTTNVQLLRAQ